MIDTIESMQTLDHEPPSSHCMRTFEKLRDKYMKPILRLADQYGDDYFKELDKPNNQPLDERECEERRRKIIRLIQKGAYGIDACKKHGAQPSSFRRIWFPKGICKHPNFRGVKWTYKQKVRR